PVLSPQSMVRIAPSTPLGTSAEGPDLGPRTEDLGLRATSGPKLRTPNNIAAEAQRHRAEGSSLRLCTTHVQLLALARRFHAAAPRSCSRGYTASTAKASVFLREAQGFLKSRRARFQKRRSRNNVFGCGGAALCLCGRFSYHRGSAAM